MYKKLDEFGVNHDCHIRKAVEDESQRLASTMPQSEAGKSGKVQKSSYSIDEDRLKTLPRKGMFVDDGDDDADDEFLLRINKKLTSVAESRQEESSALIGNENQSVKADIEKEISRKEFLCFFL